MPSIVATSSRTLYFAAATTASHVEWRRPGGEVGQQAIDHGAHRLEDRPTPAQLRLHRLHRGDGEPVALSGGEVGDQRFEQRLELARRDAGQRDATLVEQHLRVPDPVVRHQDAVGGHRDAVEPERRQPGRAQAEWVARFGRHALVAPLHEDDHHVVTDRVARVHEEEVGPHARRDRVLPPRRGHRRRDPAPPPSGSRTGQRPPTSRSSRCARPASSAIRSGAPGPVVPRGAVVSRSTAAG